MEKQKKPDFDEDHEDLLDIDEGSDHPVHERYVGEKKLKKVRSYFKEI
jgi:hypothetical protein